jgi:hypothetical protein
MPLTFAPGTTTVVKMKLVSKGAPYWQRPDLGIGPDDVKTSSGEVAVTVHNIGAADAPEAEIALKDASGKIIATASVPALKAPLDLLPKTAKIPLKAPAGADLSACTVSLDPSSKVADITRRNNEVAVSAQSPTALSVK